MLHRRRVLMVTGEIRATEDVKFIAAQVGVTKRQVPAFLVTQDTGAATAIPIVTKTVQAHVTGSMASAPTISMVTGATTAITLVPKTVQAVVIRTMDDAMAAKITLSSEMIVMYHVVKNGRTVKPAFILIAVVLLVIWDTGTNTVTKIAVSVVINVECLQVNVLYVYRDCGDKTALISVKETTAGIVDLPTVRVKHVRMGTGALIVKMFVT